MIRVIANIIIFILILNKTFASEQPDIETLKSAKTGVWLSCGATLIPTGVGWLTSGPKTEYVGPYIIAVGLAFGPSVGHFYAGQWKRGCLGIGSRVVISGIFFLLTVSAVSAEEYSTGHTIFWTGTGVVFLQILWDIATVPNSVRCYNRSLQDASKVNLVPEIDIQRNMYGLKIIYNF